MEHAIYPVLLTGWCGLAFVVFVLLFFVPAPYGRHSRPGYGPALDSRLGWFLMELPAVLGMALLYGLGAHRGWPLPAAFLMLWEVHYVHRALVYPLRLPRGRGMTLSVVAMGTLFNLVNGYVNGRYLFALGPTWAAGWLLDVRFLLGSALFGLGLGINLWADRTLRRLREEGHNRYLVPRAGLFTWVSCPNYLGELIEWCGWALGTWSLSGASFALWTAANLIPRAWTHHRWYRSTFPDYPRERRAILPFLL